MTSRERRVWTIVCWVVIPAAVLLIDAAFYVSMRAWTYNLKDHGAAAFWPIVLTWGAVFFPLAAGIFGQAIFDLWSARASTRWRVTEGLVTDSSIEISEYAQRSLIGLDTIQEYLPKVAYAYEAEGNTYNNDLTAFGLAPLESREEAERMLRPYPKGARIRVRYHPEEPSTSVLQTTGAWAFQAVGVALVSAITPFALAITMVGR